MYIISTLETVESCCMQDLFSFRQQNNQDINFFFNQHQQYIQHLQTRNVGRCLQTLCVPVGRISGSVILVPTYFTIEKMFEA